MGQAAVNTLDWRGSRRAGGLPSASQRRPAPTGLKPPNPLTPHLPLQLIGLLVDDRNVSGFCGVCLNGGDSHPKSLQQMTSELDPSRK